MFRRTSRSVSYLARAAVAPSLKQSRNTLKYVQPSIANVQSNFPFHKSQSRSYIASRLSSAIVTENLESLGDSITTAVIVAWNKEPGDAVKEDDVITVVETDKVTMDIRAKKSGVFVEALAAAKAEIAVGSPLYKIDTSATTSAAAPAAKSEPAAAAAAKPASAPAAAEPAVTKGAEHTVPVPVMGESITNGIMAKWLVKPGQHVKVDEIVASIETDKVTVEVRSPHNGIITKTFSEEGAEVAVGSNLFTIVEGAAPAGASTAKVETPAAKPAPAPAAAAPAKAVDKAAPAAAPKKEEAPKKETKKEAATAPVVAMKGDRSETRVKMTRMRQRIAARLKESQNTAAMLTTFQEVDMSNLIDLRNRYKDDFEKIHGVKLGFMSAFVRAAALSLQENPIINAVIDDQTKEVVYRNYVDISVAVASPTGLVVPVLRNTENMNFADIEKTIGMYGKKAKEGTLALEDMTGGTFTISNGGVFGSLFGTPIINPPQSAILGMHATKMRAVVVNGKVEARPMMYLALTYDHRLIDGREAVTFLKSIANKVEDPGRMLLTL